MSKSRCAGDLAKLTIGSAILLSSWTAPLTFAQTSDTTDQNNQQAAGTQNPATQPSTESPSDQNRPLRKIHRIGTAIPAPQNSISIKSTDAGRIRRQPAASGCVNCGIINFVNKIGQGTGLNAIAGGIVAGTVAREVIRQTPHAQGIAHPNTFGGIPGDYGGNMNHPGNQYHIGITMSDGSQAIIALPDASHLQQGDRVKLIDGVLVLDRE